MKRNLTLVLLICFGLITFLAFTLTAYAETWTQVNTEGFGDSNNVAVIPVISFNDYFYAGTWNSATAVKCGGLLMELIGFR